MGMSVADFLRRKNEIVRGGVTGVILVPENQIEDIPEDGKLPLVYYEPIDLQKYGFLYADFCPYCTLYIDNECNGCPMNEAGNRCSYTKGNTWARANNKWVVKSTEKDWRKLRDLIIKYTISTLKNETN